MTPYEVLGVPPSASPAEIRRAYLALARRHHPDAGGDVAEMRRLNEAWAALSPSVTAPSRASARASHVDPDVEATRPRTWDAEEDEEQYLEFEDGGRVPSRRARLIDNLTLLILLAWVWAAALSFLFALLFESGPLLGFCVFCLFMSGVFVVARTLLAMGFDRAHDR
jgi:hypothetical protein